MSLNKMIWIAPLAVIGYDCMASVASLMLGFQYGYAAFGSALIYGVTGYFAARTSTFALSFLVGISAGLVDATVGWGVSWAIGPGRRPNNSISFSQWSFAAMSVTAMAVICATVGGLIARMLQSRGVG